MHASPSDHEKYAIIGIGCRMPPAANSLDAFWKFLLRGGNALKSVRKDRWDWRQFFDEDQNRPGKMYAPKFGMLDADVKLFDPLAFGISPREGACMDPQQRLLLETTWEAFENAGIPVEQMSGSRTGVFIGGFCLDHLIMQMRPWSRHLLNANSPAGATMTVLSNRISHVFNLRGPSVTMDTACSSSLVAIHYACQSLRNGDSEMAIAGGSNVMTCPDNPIMMSKGHFLSYHGECHTFDETAAGYARGEGAGVFLIKPLAKALSDGNPIHAVIRGTGVNQDGHTDGISLPSGPAQEELVRDVYRRAGVSPGDVDYVEAHGTGTQAGDPAEASALNKHFAAGRARKLLVGSVKTNVGHLEAAAGVAGMLKTIGVLKNRQVPKNLHFEHPNPKIPFDEYGLQVVAETTDLLPPEEKPTLFAGVNAFGYGGTNAHIILESAPSRDPVETREPTGLMVIPFSARSETALRDLAGKFAFQLGQGPQGTLADFAHTAAFRRSHLECRCAAVAESLPELRAQLIATSTGQPHEGIAVGTHPVESTSGLVFVYTGMGPQWWAMGRELIRDEPIVAATVKEIDTIFRELSGWSLWDAMLADEPLSRMERTEVAQPANFALQIALTRLWKSFGIRPAAVVGHSVGEVVSAFVAGVYSLEDAVRVSFHRSRLQQTTAGRGAMLAVGLPEAEALKRIKDSAGISVAAVNSFSAVTLSGDADQLRAIAAELEREEVFQKFLRVEVAYHSPQMDPLKDELLASLAGLTPRSSALPLYSTAFGEQIPDEKWAAEYWWKNVRQPVHFAQAVQALMDDGLTSFLEIGPHPVLGNSIKECAIHIERKVNVFTSLRRKEPEKKRILLTLAELYCAGHEPDWKALAPERGQFLAGPLYPWQRQAHWLESERSRMDRLGLPGPVYLNRSLAGPLPAWEVEINKNYFPFLPDHGVQDQTVFAGMGYVEAALTLSQQIHQSAAVVLENVSFEKVLIVDDSKLQYLITSYDPDGGRFAISSRVEGEDDGAVQRHCRGRMIPQTESRPPTFDIGKVKAECPHAVAIPEFYQRLQRRGLTYGKTFRPSSEIFVGEDCFFVKMDAGDAAGEKAHPLHPTLFDAAIQPVLYCSKGERLFVPFGIDQFEYYSRPEQAECYVFGRLVCQSETMIVADIWLMGSTGAVHAHARHMSCQVIETEQKTPEKGLFYQLEWKPAPVEETEALVEGPELILVTDTDDTDQKLADELAARLPGAVTFDPRTEPAEGFGKDRWARLISQESRRDRFIVLWGTSPDNAGDSAEAFRDFDEKVIGILQAAGECSRTLDITFVTRRASEVNPGEPVDNLPAACAGALALVAQNEYEGLSCRTIDIDGNDSGETAETILAEIRARSHGDVAYRNKARFERVLSAVSEKGNEAQFAAVSVEEPVELKLGTKGKLDSLRYEHSFRRAPGEGEVELRIHGTALNYKDLLKIDGRIHPTALESTFNGPDFGMECMGVVVRSGPGSPFEPGDRVATILQRGFRTYATVPETFVIRIPKGIGIEAAGIPVVYLAAYRGLIEIARLQPGERVLIHHATGGVGLAAIEISRWIGAEIFATAGSKEKRDYLKRQGIERVYSSRDLDFGQRIREVTNHEGVDVGIGAQTGQALHLSLGLLRAGGRYIEIGKRDIAEDNGLPLRPFNRGVTFAAVDIDRLTHDRPEEIRRELKTIFEHLAEGDFKPGPSRVLPAKDIREGFREMAQSRHIGKLIADFSDGKIEVLERPESGPGIRSDGCYVVTGGTSGFGLLTGCWLAEQGAGRVILVSRSGRNAPAFTGLVAHQMAEHPKVEVVAADVTDAGQVQALISTANGGGFRLRGVVHSAMVLDDVMMAGLTQERFRKVFKPKVAGAFHLADALKGNEALDFLVFYSSISALVGNRGQTSYVAANGALDVLARRLRSEGMPAISINWGALAETGVVARDDRLGSVLSSGGITGLGDQEALSALKEAIRLAKPQLGVFRIDWQKWFSANPGLAEDPRFRELGIKSRTDNGSDAASRFRQTHIHSSREQRLRSLEDHLQDVLAGTLRMSKEGISLKKKLSEMGVDSLMVLELGLGIRDRIGVNFSAMEFLKGPTLEQLAALAENKIWNPQGKGTST